MATICNCCSEAGFLCGQCCTQWELPGGAGLIPDEISVAINVPSFSRCYTAGKVIGSNIVWFTSLDDVEFDETLILTRSSAGEGECATWSFINCNGTESVNCVVGLTYNPTEGKCFWNIVFSYVRCIPSSCDPLNTEPNNLCCDNETYGYKAGFGFSALAGDADAVEEMTSPCSGATFNIARTVSGGPFAVGNNWSNWCGSGANDCSTFPNLCSTISPPDCPDTISVTATAQITV